MGATITVTEAGGQSHGYQLEGDPMQRVPVDEYGAAAPSDARVTTAKPEEWYTTPNYQWPYGEDTSGD
jgi:hypothetical protein